MIRPIAVVTGAGRNAGVGSATARLLAERGWAVVVTERTPESLTMAERESGWKGAASVADEIIAGGGAAWSHTCDVRDQESVDAMAEFIAGLGQISVLINNAGTPGEANSFRIHETPEDVFQATVDTNLTGTYRVIRRIVPLMEHHSATDKAIVNLSSAASIRPLPYFGSYSASKAGVDAMTRQMALELAPMGIRVNAVSPGPVATDMAEGSYGRSAARFGVTIDKVREATARRLPLKRASDPREQAEAIVFLASPAASYITGQVLQVDGGMTLA